MSCLRLAHISDLHFVKRDLTLLHLFSKRLLGNINFFFGRERAFAHERLDLLPDILKSQKITHLLITGDFTVTSSPAELKKAQAFVQQFRDRGIEVFCIPGNHDQYTRKAYRLQLFYEYFPSQWDPSLPYDLKKNGITVKKISHEWWVVGLDTTLATPWFFSSGQFFQRVEKSLVTFLSELSQNQKVILINHFPFFKHDGFRTQLERGERLKEILLNTSSVKIFCHGHTHRHCVADLQASNLPILFDSGSTPHRSKGFFNLLSLSKEQLKTEVYGWKEGGWSAVQKGVYELV